MTYLIMQMLLCLVVAFLLGLLLGWWLGRRRLQQRVLEIENRWNAKLGRCHQELRAARAEVERLSAGAGSEAALAELRAELAACRRELEECRARQVADPSARPGALPAALADLGKPAGGAQDDAVAEPDDLKVVEGIGPKIEGLLNAAGIHTWTRLAAAEVSFLQSVLDQAGPRYRIHDPGTWPRQAALAAAGSRDELKVLQDRLKGGRES